MSTRRAMDRIMDVLMHVEHPLQAKDISELSGVERDTATEAIQHLVRDRLVSIYDPRSTIEAYWLNPNFGCQTELWQ